MCNLLLFEHNYQPMQPNSVAAQLRRRLPHLVNVFQYFDGRWALQFDGYIDYSKFAILCASVQWSQFERDYDLLFMNIVLFTMSCHFRSARCPATYNCFSDLAE